MKNKIVGNKRIDGKSIDEKKNESKTISEFEELLIKISAVLMVFTISIFAIMSFFKQTEKLEWLIYEVSAIAVSAVFLGVCIAFNKIKITQVASNKFYLFAISIFSVFLIYLSARSFMRIEYYLFFCLIAMLPTIIRNSQSKNEKLTLSAYFFNAVSILCMLSFVIIDSFSLKVRNAFIDSSHFSIGQVLLVVVLSGIILFSYLLIKAPLKEDLDKNSKIKTKDVENETKSLPLAKQALSLLFGTMVVVVSSILLFILSLRTVDYHHFSFYLGPIYDVLNGKSILYDIPSQYGYWSIHFLAKIFQMIKPTYESFNFVDIGLYVFFDIIAGMIFFKLFRKLGLTLLCTFIFAGFQTLFSYWNMGMYPSCGPLRFGIGVLICFILIFMRGRAGFIISSILAACSLFWSIETMIYVVPAWLFICVIGALKDGKFSPKILLNIIIRIVFFVTVSVSFMYAIFLAEKRVGRNFEWINNFAQYALSYRDGFGSIFVATFDNHYLPIAFMILSLGVMFHLIVKWNYTALFPAFAFMTIHNVATFSYFISRSHENNINNLAPMFLISAVLLFKIIQESGIASWKEMKKFVLIPVVIFCAMYILRSTYNYSNTKIFWQKAWNNNQSAKVVSYISPENIEMINEWKKEYDLKNKKVLVLSTADTLILTKLELINELPYNPAIMTQILSNWKEKYLNPSLERITEGTMVIFDSYYDQTQDNIIDYLDGKFESEILKEFDIIKGDRTMYLLKIGAKKST